MQSYGAEPNQAVPQNGSQPPPLAGSDSLWGVSPLSGIPRTAGQQHPAVELAAPQRTLPEPWLPWNGVRIDAFAADAGSAVGIGWDSHRQRRRKLLVPEKFDGKADDWPEYLAHFNIIVEINEWSDREKAMNLASSARGKLDVWCPP